MAAAIPFAAKETTKSALEVPPGFLLPLATLSIISGPHQGGWERELSSRTQLGFATRVKAEDRY